MGTFDYYRKDKNGDVPDLRLLNKKFVHSNGETYTVVGFTFIGDTDEWGVTHTREGCDVPFTRTLRNFYAPGRHVPA